MLDLTPFGFTPTESTTYRILLELGPSSGYAVARALSIARANAYQALDGLVAKGAAVLADAATPRRYRAVQPRTLFAQILAAQSGRLDELERAVLAQPATGAATHLRVRGARAVLDLAVRAVVRAEGPVQCVTTAPLLEALAPAVRARQAARRETRLWGAGPPVGSDFPAPVNAIAPERLQALGDPNALLLVADGALAASVGDDAEGFWSESRLHVGLVSAAIAHVADIQPTR
jgi:sugar-specific transcriptional regulator TrmB